MIPCFGKTFFFLLPEQPWKCKTRRIRKGVIAVRPSEELIAKGWRKDFPDLYIRALG
jgi:hypothetical protein